MSKTPPSQGKGDKRRPTDEDTYRRHYDSINWGRPRKPTKRQVKEVIDAEFAAERAAIEAELARQSDLDNESNT